MRTCSTQNLKSTGVNVLKDEFVYGCLKDEEVIAQVMVEWNNFQNILITTLLSIFRVIHDTRIWSESDTVSDVVGIYVKWRSDFQSGPKL